VLIVEAPKHENRNLELSARNIEGLELVPATRFILITLLRYDRVIFSQPAIEKLQLSLKRFDCRSGSTRRRKDEGAKKARLLRGARAA
jgi:hypothetical protein